MKGIFKLETKISEGSAFEDDPRGELVRMLKEVVEKVESGRDFGIIHDINGNISGTFEDFDE
jgi:hypothetical protein